jgi:hypothetical protein
MEVIERVMQTYGLLVTLTPEQEAMTRQKVKKFLEDKSGDDRMLAVEAIKFLRGARVVRARRPAPRRHGPLSETAK